MLDIRKKLQGKPSDCTHPPQCGMPLSNMCNWAKDRSLVSALHMKLHGFANAHRLWIVFYL